MRPARRFVLIAFAAVLSGAFLTTAVDARSRREASLPGTASSVDVSRLRSLGLGVAADLIQTTLSREVANGIGSGRVAIVITGFSMSSYAGSEGGGGGAGGAGGGGSGVSETDYLEGEALRLGPGGEILDRRRQVVSLPANSGGPYYLPGAEQRRIVALSRAFADWLRRSAL